MPDVSSKDLEIIALKLDQMQERQAETSQTVNEIHRSLVDPKDGLYTQVADLRRWSEEHERADSQMREQVQDIAKMVHPMVRRTESLELQLEENGERDSELRTSVIKISKAMEPLTDDYKVRQSRKKWTDKILWFIIAAVLTSLVPTVKYVLFDAPSEHNKIQKLEQKVEKQERENGRLER